MQKKKMIILNVSITAVVLCLVLVGTYICLVFWTPGFLAKIYEKVNVKTSMKYYIRQYEKTETTSDLYTVVDKAISFKNDDVLLEYFPELSERENYNELINYVNSLNYNEENATAVNLFMVNEDNRLKSRYVKALAEDNVGIAFSYAILDLNNMLSQMEGSEVVGKDGLNFVFSGLASKVEDMKTYFTAENVNKIKTFYSELKDEYTNNSELTDFEKIVYCYKTIEVGQFLLLMNSKEIEGIDATTLNTDKTTLSQDLAGFLA